jgi:LemA protein
MKKSLIVIIVLALLIIIPVSRGVKINNNFITLEEGVDAQWAQVENVYQRRLDLIPNLVNTVKGYAAHESETLTAVVEARAKATQTTVNAGNTQQLQQSQGALTSALSKLMVVVEKYPDLKANQNFMQLQSQLEGTENRIATERRRYNEICKSYNTEIRQFPQSFIANMRGFDKKDYFEADKAADKAPVVDFQ